MGEPWIAASPMSYVFLLWWMQGSTGVVVRVASVLCVLPEASVHIRWRRSAGLDV